MINLKYYYTIYVKDALQMSNFSEDDVRRAAEIREWLVKQISDRQEEIERLRTTLLLIDNLLKHGSFRPASNITSSVTLSHSASAEAPVNAAKISSNPIKQQRTATSADSMAETITNSSEPQATNEVKEFRPLKRVKDNLLLANAELLPNSVEIVPAEGIILNVNTPPFRSFFLNRILEGMKTKDAEKVSQKQIKDTESLNYQVEEDTNGSIKKIIIINYREKERLNEIFNTSTWVFTRMIEKSGK
ncbi:MAG TPA: hypothetical protein VHF08_00315 [Nitrososphaeraceae archaeon]|nr:hypothetical protein [Nitrososphaeraceae archaeon]